MEYVDEKILEILNEKEKENAPRDIYKDQIRIDNRYYEFEETYFLEEKLSMYIPKDFIDMPEEAKNMKYPSVHRPKIIKTDDSGSVNININPIDNELKEEWVQELTTGMKGIIQRSSPSSVFYSEGMENVEGKNIGYFEFKSPALDESIYNLMFFFELEGKTIMGTFCCKFKDYEEWRDIAFQIIKSIRVTEGEEKI